MDYAEGTHIFVPVSKSGHSAGLIELSTARQWAYAFTSQRKAKKFLKTLPVEINRLLPCTLGEWFEWQPQKGLPDLTIDPDSKQLRDYPFQVKANPTTDDVRCLTRESAEGKSFEVHVRRRRDFKQ